MGRGEYLEVVAWEVDGEGDEEEGGAQERIGWRAEQADQSSPELDPGCVQLSRCRGQGRWSIGGLGCLLRDGACWRHRLWSGTGALGSDQWMDSGVHEATSKGEAAKHEEPDSPHGVGKAAIVQEVIEEDGQCQTCMLADE